MVGQSSHLVSSAQPNSAVAVLALQSLTRFSAEQVCQRSCDSSDKLIQCFKVLNTGSFVTVLMQCWTVLGRCPAPLASRGRLKLLPAQTTMKHTVCGSDWWSLSRTLKLSSCPVITSSEANFDRMRSYLSNFSNT